MTTPIDEVNASDYSAVDTRKLKKFRALVRYANTHSRYYQQLIAERGISLETCVPTDFPLLTKAILMANFDEIVTDQSITKQAIANFLSKSTDPSDLFLKKYTVMHTSGTSGEVGYFLTKKSDMRRSFRGSLFRFRRGSGSSMGGPKLRLRRQRLAFYGATGGHFAGATAVARMQKGLARLFLKAIPFEVNSPLPLVVEQLNEFKPDFIFGYTTALKMLGEQQRQGRLQITPRAIAATGETVTKEDILYLSESFAGVRVVGLYACTEHMMMGVTNSDFETMTLTDGNLIMEFFDDHSVVTNLFNYTMPLIRYRMSDILRPVSARGEHPVVVENLVGRSEKMPNFRNTAGAMDFISPHTINEVFVKGVTRFQMQITSDTSFRFPVCVDSDLSEDQRIAIIHSVEQRLRDILRQKGLENVHFDVPIVADISVNSRTRKFQLIVDNRSS